MDPGVGWALIWGKLRYESQLESVPAVQGRASQARRSVVVEFLGDRHLVVVCLRWAWMRVGSINNVGTVEAVFLEFC